MTAMADGTHPEGGTGAAMEGIVGRKGVVICCGPGGVGKTTVAAALALEAARRGRRAVVVTVDPAKRLGDALGHGSLGDTATRIPGDWPGELWALMLDTERTFDGLVNRYAPGPGQAAAILDNAFYRNIAGALSGTQEFMAMEKLFELHADERFDLVVVDTPPTRNALDFVDAPRRLVRFLDNRVFRLLMAPTRASLKAVNFATQAFLRSVSKVVGGEVVQDAVTFFQAFEGMEDGFRERARRVGELLTDPTTSFVVVSSPRRDSVEEASYFVSKLAETDIAVGALVVNRMHPRFGGSDMGGGAGSVAAGSAATRQRALSLAGTPLGGLYANLADLQEMAGSEEVHIRTLVERVGPAPTVRIPLLADDVHDVTGLEQVARYVVAG